MGQTTTRGRNGTRGMAIDAERNLIGRFPGTAMQKRSYRAALMSLRACFADPSRWQRQHYEEAEMPNSDARLLAGRIR